MESGSQKVFGIGLGRTGTSSLAAAMRILGYRVRHSPRTVDEIGEADFSNDISVAWRYLFLDYIFPDALFILTVRDVESWLRSCEKHSMKMGRRGPLRRLEQRFMCFGRTDFDCETFRQRFLSHNLAVTDHFCSRPGKLLILDICEGVDWPTLCDFLKKPYPSRPFPHLNRSSCK